MIFLHKPYIEKKDAKSRLIFDVEVDKEKKQVWFEVEKKYEKYLSSDRVDAIYVGLLHYAMLYGHDFKSDCFLTEELYYQTTEHLIPVLASTSCKMKQIKVEIPTIPTSKTANKTGTGCSGGIDSFYAILRHLSYPNPNFRLDYLCINNVGSFNECYREAGSRKVRDKRVEEARKIAKEVGLPLIVTDSNFQEQFPQSHLTTVAYSSTFAILCLQKLWGKYYYGSDGLGYRYFTVENAETTTSSYYDLLNVNVFSTYHTRIYSDGGGRLRLDKVKEIYQSDLVKKYLHVCTTREYNCGKCPKCRHVLLSLYVLKANMEEYNQVFDIEYFQSHLEEYFNWIYEEHLWNPHFEMFQKVYEELQKDEEFQEFLKKKNPKEKEEENVDPYKEMYEKVIESKTFKVGNAIMKVPRKIKECFKK